MRVEIGAIAPRPPFWVMYTANHPALTTWPRQATLRPPWWTIPEAYRLHMQAFTRPSHQLRQKVRAATLRSMHHTSIYRRLILQARTQGAQTTTTGASLHTHLREHPKEDTNLLKFIYGRLYNGKLAKRYGHAPDGRVPLMPPPRLMHTHCRRVRCAQTPLDQPSQRGMPAHTRCNTQLFQRRRRTLHCRSPTSSGGVRW